MSSVRLTNEMREIVVERVMRDHFAGRDDKLAALQVELADAVYLHAFGEDLPRVHELPHYWVDRVEEIHVDCDGFKSKWTRSPEMPPADLRLSKERPIPANVGKAFTIEKGHPLMVQAQALVCATKLLHDQRSNLREQLRSLLASARTVAKLREIWPEGERFYGALMPKKDQPLVDANLVLDINKKLGL